MGRAAPPCHAPLATPPTWVGPHLATPLLDLATPRHASPRLKTASPCWQFAHSISGLPVVTTIPAIKEADPKV